MVIKTTQSRGHKLICPQDQERKYKDRSRLVSETTGNDDDYGELLANKGIHYSAPVIYCHGGRWTQCYQIF